MQRAREALLAYAEEHGYARTDTDVYAPVIGSDGERLPCAYERRCTHDQFINEALHGNVAFRSDPAVFDAMRRVCKRVDDHRLPLHQPDQDLLAFQNGVLELASRRFTPYGNITPATPLSRRAARQFIRREWGATTAPLFESVLRKQEGFDAELVEVFYALIGRMLFPAGELDDWRVSLFLQGVGGSGKSLVLDVVQSMTRREAVGSWFTSAGPRRLLAALHDNEMVLVRLAVKWSAALESAPDATGSRAQLAVFSNHVPADQVTRGAPHRFATFFFGSEVEGVAWSAIERELPAIVHLALHAYARLRERVGEAGRFWDHVPSRLRSWSGVT